MTSSISEDDIIKKRLLIEGDSGNEDRCINKLIKLFIKWCNNISQDKQTQQQNQQDDDLSEITNAHEMMLAVMSHIEFGLMRNQFIFDMNKVEQENYEKLYKNIDYDVEKAKADIKQSKLDLQKAKKIRENRQKYDVLAREINIYPDRQEMKATIERLEKELEHLKECKIDLNHKIELRHKQFSAVVKTISSLKILLDNDQYNDVSIIDDTMNTINDSSIFNESRMELNETDNNFNSEKVSSNNNGNGHSNQNGDVYTNEPSPADNKNGDLNGDDKIAINLKMEMD